LKTSEGFRLSAVGAAIGIFLGGSVGVASGGTAYNAALLFGIFGAFVGWLIGLVIDQSKEQPLDQNLGRDDKNGTGESEVPLDTGSKPTAADELLRAAFIILATCWNFHIDILKNLSILPVFVEKPWLFFVFPLVVTVFFPPFAVIYFVCYLGASQFTMSADTEYRSIIAPRSGN
jgi:hypothetical protein